MTARRILVTSALPYANGHIHLGHLVEYIQTDIWVRFQRLSWQSLHLHLRRRYPRHGDHDPGPQGRAAGSGIDRRYASGPCAGFRWLRRAVRPLRQHQQPLESRVVRPLLGRPAQSRADLRKGSPQLYDPQAGTFLADRFVKGTCPKCHSPNQYGDSCDKCGTTYSPTDLIDPVSVLSGATPSCARPALVRNTEQMHAFLNEWTQTGDHLHPDVAKWLAGAFLSEPLRDWDVSRPAPYFGFEIPDAPGNYWYVWFDAPIGYLASTHDWCSKTGEKFDDWWRSPQTEVHHFIGKDITYFHTLFWPVCSRRPASICRAWSTSMDS